MNKIEFDITSCKQYNLNDHIQAIKTQKPKYEVFNISVSGRGGVIMGTTTVYIVWKLKGDMND